MSKYSKSIYTLLAAFSFYYFFGYFTPEVVGIPRAAQSIASAMKVVVFILTSALVILALVQFLRARNN